MASTAAHEFGQTPADFGGASASRLSGLDALRGIAALAVLVFHALAIFGAGRGWSGKGYLAVDFFFMLSGYVMARTYEARLANGYAAGRFLLARYRRLWPVMAIGALVGAPLLLLKSSDPVSFATTFALNILLLPIFTGSLIFPVNGSAWSILFELGANLLHAVVLWRLRASSLVVVIGIAAAAMAWAALDFGSFDIGARPRNVIGGLPRAILAYTIGILLWRLWRDRPWVKVPPLAALLIIPLFMGAVSLARAESLLLDFAFVLVLCPLMMAGGLRCRGWQAFGRWAGALSFPLYAVHMPLLNAAKYLDLGPFVGASLACLLAGLVALVLESRRADAREET